MFYSKSKKSFLEPVYGSEFTFSPCRLFAKYSDEVGLDDLPDPDVFFARKYIKDAYKAYMSHVNKKYIEKAMESIEYVFVG